MKPEDYKTFCCSYPFEGGQWGFDIKAQSQEEAEARLKAMCWAKVDGELIERIPAVPGASLYVRLSCWLANRFAKRA